jgi:DNA-binding NtrC family response regulator
MSFSQNTAILVVDDDVLLTMALKMELQRHYGQRYAIESAYNAAGAEKLLGELFEDGIRTILVISDWMMPGMRGDALLERVRASYPGMKTILLSGYACDNNVQRLYDIHCLDAFVAKPWTAANLFCTIDRLINED